MKFIAWITCVAAAHLPSGPALGRPPYIQVISLESKTGVIELHITDPAGNLGAYWIHQEDLESPELRLNKVISGRTDGKHTVQVLLPPTQGSDQPRKADLSPRGTGIVYLGIAPEVFVFELALRQWRRIADLIEPKLAANP